MKKVTQKKDCSSCYMFDLMKSTKEAYFKLKMDLENAQKAKEELVVKKAFEAVPSLVEELHLN